MRRPVQNQPALLGQRQHTDVMEPQSDNGAGDEEMTESYINSFYEEVKHAGSRPLIETFDNTAHLKINKIIKKNYKNLCQTNKITPKFSSNKSNTVPSMHCSMNRR